MLYSIIKYNIRYRIVSVVCAPVKNIPMAHKCDLC